jgi:hypothetical protein
MIDHYTHLVPFDEDCIIFFYLRYLNIHYMYLFEVKSDHDIFLQKFLFYFVIQVCYIGLECPLKTRIVVQA